MADLDHVTPLTPTWPVRPADRVGERRRPPRQPPQSDPNVAGEDDSRDGDAADRPAGVDEYA